MNMNIQKRHLHLILDNGYFGIKLFDRAYIQCKDTRVFPLMNSEIDRGLQIGNIWIEMKII